MEKILVIAANNLAKGGVQSIIMSIIRLLSSEYQFDVVTFDNHYSDHVQDVENYGGHVYRIPCYDGNNLLRKKIDFYIRGCYLKRETERIIRDNGPYIAVHSHKMVESGPFMIAAQKCGVPVRIAHAHTAFERHYNPIAKVYTALLAKMIHRYATAKVACSEKAGKSLFGKGYRVIYNTIDRRFLEGSTEHVANCDPVLLQVGLICDNKNQLFSIQTLKELQTRYPAARLVLIGGPKDEQMEAYFQKLKDFTVAEALADSVSFLPADSDVKAEMQKADYLLLPSHYEGLPIVALEAQSVGMKCFASTGVPVEVDCGGCIFLSLNNGAESWANRIAQQFEEDHGARQKNDMSRFMPDVIMEQYRKLYRGELD